MKISIGNSNTGYNTAEVTKTKTGKYRIVPGTICGFSGVIRRAVAQANRGETGYTAPSGDCFAVRINT